MTGNRRFRRTTMASFTRAAVILVFCAVVCALHGCSTAGNSSDVPWNVPQPWEGTPNIPGSL